MGEEMDLGDIVISWSVQEIIDDDLYKGQVRGRSIPPVGCDDLCGRFFSPLIRLCDGEVAAAAAADVRWLIRSGGDGRGPRCGGDGGRGPGRPVQRRGVEETWLAGGEKGSGGGHYNCLPS